MKNLIGLACIFLSGTVYAASHDCTVYNTYTPSKYFSGKINDNQVILINKNNVVEVRDLNEIAGYVAPEGTKEFFFVRTTMAVGEKPSNSRLEFITSNNIIAGGSAVVFLTGNDGISLECRK